MLDQASSQYIGTRATVFCFCEVLPMQRMVTSSGGRVGQNLVFKYKS